MHDPVPLPLPRVVAALGDLLTLLPNAVVLDHSGDAWQLNSAGGTRWWTGTRNSEPWATAELWSTFAAYGQFLVIYDGGDALRASPSAVDTWDLTAPATPDPTPKDDDMGAPSKIIDETEVIRWIEAGRTYRWIQEEYRRKYGIETGLAMWSNFRHRRGLDRRIARDHDLIPWDVKAEHRHNYYLTMLRVEARKRAGLELRPTDVKRLKSWLDDLSELNAVVMYDAETPDGFYLVPREPGDIDLIREPDRASARTKRRRAD